MEHEWFKPSGAAAHIGCSTSYLAKMRLVDGGPRFCRIGRAIRYNRRDLDAWMEASARHSTSGNSFDRVSVKR